MHSTISRAQAVFGLFTSVAFAVALASTISVLFYPQTPTARLSMRSNQVVNGRSSPRSPNKIEYAHIRFDLDAGKDPLSRPPLHLNQLPPYQLTDPLSPHRSDLTSLFTYNTKQVFVYVQATWPSTSTSTSTPTSSEQPPPHQAVIWDQIISSPPTPFSVFLSKLTTTVSSLLSSKTSPSRKPQPKKPTRSTPPAPGLIKLRNQRPKYPIADISGLLSGVENATLRLGYNVQPWVGALLWDRTGSLGRWQGLESKGAQWRFGERKLSAKEVLRKNEQEAAAAAAAAAAEGGVKKQGGKAEGGMAKPVVEI